MTKTNHILAVDDEPGFRLLVRATLESQGYTVTEVADGPGALRAAFTQPEADLMLLDLSMRGMDGLQVISELRSSGSSIPIVVLSSRGDDDAKVRALDSGADDYVTKPFSSPELLARIRTALRHRQQRREGEQPVLRAGELAIDLWRGQVTLSGKDIQLSSKEFGLLRLLVRNAGRVLTHAHILNEVWAGESDALNLRNHIRALRHKLGDVPESPRFIFTEHGIGYRFLAPLAPG